MTATDRSIELINVAAQAAADKLAHDIIAYDVSDVLSIDRSLEVHSCFRQHSYVYVRGRIARPGSKNVISAWDGVALGNFGVLSGVRSIRPGGVLASAGP